MISQGLESPEPVASTSGLGMLTVVAVGRFGGRSRSPEVVAVAAEGVLHVLELIPAGEPGRRTSFSVEPWATIGPDKRGSSPPLSLKASA
jgi:hypothetical protein